MTEIEETIRETSRREYRLMAEHCEMLQASWRVAYEHAMSNVPRRKRDRVRREASRLMFAGHAR